MRNLLFTILIAAICGLVPAAALAQSNSGLDAYTENPGVPGGETGTAPGVPDATSGTAGSGTAGSGTAPAGSGGAGTGTDSAGGLTEEAAARLGQTPSGQLPATGFDETIF